jgi:hypothetical protein
VGPLSGFALQAPVLDVPASAGSFRDARTGLSQRNV